MKMLLLTKVRLSWYFAIFFSIYFALTYLLPRQKFDAAALTLFSVNSFLYGFYISPIVSAQKARIEELHKIVRNEANALFAMVLMTKDLPKQLRNALQDKFIEYMKSNASEQLEDGEHHYEELIGFCVEYKGDHAEEIDKLLDKLVANQQNRTMLSMQMNNRVFNNEWMVMMVLFTITLSFILLIDTGTKIVFHIVAALLCTSLSMLILVLLKLSTLTHKKAKQIWQPFEKLLTSRFYRID